MKKLIPIEMIEDGMVTAECIKNKYGQVMLSENVRLELKQKKMLMLWGITSVQILAENETLSEINHDPEMIQKASELLKDKILWTPINKFDEEIYQIALEHILETPNS